MQSTNDTIFLQSYMPNMLILSKLLIEMLTDSQVCNCNKIEYFVPLEN